MRFARLLFLSLALVLPASAADLEIVRIWSGYRPAESFERISEYFTGRENPGRQTILRSQSGERAGYYWLIRTKAAGPIPDVRLELTVTLPGNRTPTVFRFETDLPSGSHVTLSGITGTDWPDAQANPVTWQLRLLAADGTELGRDQSFLWTPGAAPQPPRS